MFQRGKRLRCFGEVRAGPTGLEMVHPEYQFIETKDAPLDSALTPVYPSTDGLHQQRLRKLIDQVLNLLTRSPLDDVLADQLQAPWPTVNEALEALHRPPPDCDTAALLAGTSEWQRRLALEELVAHRASLKSNALTDADSGAVRLLPAPGRLAELTTALPFELTSAQRSAIDEILADIGRAQPMQRLLQGDVGSGKTVVAAAAAFTAADCGYQTAVMAPTELLAEQHFANFQQWLEPLGVAVDFLSGSVGVRARERLREKLAAGTTQILIGTHALIQSGVDFSALALTIVDEQHRFGVDQRLTLKQKGAHASQVPHQLIMTATPIPRTLAMTIYADLECSIIDELPPGRSPVRTVAVPESRRAELVHRVAEHCRADQQAYWVCPLIDESDVLESSAAAELEKALSEALPEVSVGLLHGRMRPVEKDRVMRRFKQGDLKLLVATTVVEVGVDVPNATLMVIENSERMGLAQLHQLRGRVGRGRQVSNCVLMYKPPLTDVARQRLRVMRETTDGFRIAQEDLRLRGPGEMLGTRQTGIGRLKIADLTRDVDMLPDVIRISDDLMQHHPDRVGPLIRRWIRAAERYAGV